MDVLNGSFLSIDQIAAAVPPNRHGKQVAFSTVFRWIFTGIKAANGERVKLQAVKLGGRFLVSREALQSFVETLSARPDAPAPIQTPAERTRRAAAAKRKLASMGI